MTPAQDTPQEIGCENPPTTEKILLIVSDRTDRKLLTRTLADQYDLYTSVDTDLPDEEMDLVILDLPGLRGFTQKLTVYKEDATPVFLPYLLLVPEERSGRLPADVWDHVDGVARLPITKEELHARVEGFLHSRRLAVIAQRETDRFANVANVIAHDLRNPLNVIDGYIERAQATDDVEILDPAAEAVEHAAALIENVLTVARHGQTALSTVSVELESVVTTAWDHVETKRASLEVDSTAVVQADRTQLQELFENLLQNAVEHGGADVTVRIGIRDVSGHATIYVIDNGRGLPGTDDLFDMGVTTAEDGTGFGLAIVGEIIALHNWEIKAMESQDGGARFEITGIDVSEVPNCKESV